MPSTSGRKTRVLTFLVVLGLGTLLLLPLFIFSYLRVFDLAIQPMEIIDAVDRDRLTGTAFSTSASIYLFSDSASYTLSSPGYYQETVELSKEQAGSLIEITLKPLPGYLDVIVGQDYPVSITIDGQPLENLAGIELPQGEYTVGMFRDDYELASRHISMRGRGEQQTIEFDLTQFQAHVNVGTVPRSAQIELDGKVIGYGNFSGGIAAGSHEIRVTQRGYGTKTIDFEVNVGDRKEIGKIELTPLPVSVTIETTPPNASVLLDGKYIGESNLDFQLMPSKSYELVVKKPGFEDRRLQLVPQIGKTLSRSINFQAESIKVAVEIKPKGSVFVNGQNRGQAPTTVVVYSDDVVEARSPGLKTQTKTIDHVEGQKQQLSFELLEPADHAYQFAPQTLSVAGDLELERFPPMSYTQTPIGKGEVSRHVVLTRPFFLGKTEVTNKAFNAFSKGSRTPDNYPVTRVSWTQAARFCNWLSAQEGLKPVYQLSGTGVFQSVDTQSLGYRLPTELEWEAGAGFDWRANIVAEPYSWGAMALIPVGIGNLAGQEMQGAGGRVLADYVDDHPAVAPVGSYNPSFNGLYDMNGNVAEWVHDFYEIKRQEPTADYLGPKVGFAHVVKGSSFESDSIDELKVYARQNVRSYEPNVGFRIAKWIY